jgi:hypothetical protein
MAKLPNAIYKFSAILIKIPISFFTEIEISILKLIWKCKGVQIAEVSLAKIAILDVLQHQTSNYITEP